MPCLPSRSFVTNQAPVVNCSRIQLFKISILGGKGRIRMQMSELESLGSSEKRQGQCSKEMIC